MAGSILNDIKKICNVPEDYDVFDQDLILHTNSIFMVLQQLGVGPDSGFSISGASETWDDYEGVDDMQALKTYLSLRVKMLFDPNGSSYVISSMEKVISEMEWRLCLQAEEVKESG